MMVKPACKRDVVLTFKGIHPNTRDSDVFEYLEKYGSLVTKRVIYGVFADGPLKGIKNGDRSYKLEIRPKTNIGSYHLIDGHRVQLRYPGQQQTCGRCFQVSSGCIGKGVARRCEVAGGAKKDFKVYIAELWSKIGYNPNIEVNGSDSENDLDSEVNKQIGGTFTPIKSAESLPYAFAGVTIRQIPSDIDHGEVMEFLFEAGLPEIKADYVTIKDNGTVIIKDIENEVCVELIRNIHGKMGFSKKLFCNGIVPMTPVKDTNKPAETAIISQQNGEEQVLSKIDSITVVNDQISLPNLLSPMPRSPPFSNYGAHDLARRHSLSLLNRTPPPGSLADDLLQLPVPRPLSTHHGLLNNIKDLAESLSDFNSCRSLSSSDDTDLETSSSSKKKD